MKYASKEKRTGTIWLAVFLAAFIPALAELVIVAVFSDYSRLLAFVKPGTFTELSYGFIQAIMSSLTWFAPLPLGFYAALKWPGPHPGRYILFGAVAGVLSMPLVMGAYAAAATLDRHSGWLSGTPSLDWWMRSPYVLALFFVEWFVLTALLFISGALLGDVAKLRALHREDLWKEGRAGKAAEYLSNKTKISKERLVTFIRWAGASSPALLAAVISAGAALINLLNTAVTAVVKSIDLGEIVDRLRALFSYSGLR